jgi:hypothetical protein
MSSAHHRNRQARRVFALNYLDLKTAFKNTAGIIFVRFNGD